jgi:Flp pilus assembly secretin CpaC
MLLVCVRERWLASASDGREERRRALYAHITEEPVFATRFFSSIASVAIVVSAELATPVGAQSVAFLSLQSGHSTVVNADGLTRAAVGDGRIAGVIAVGTSQVVINAKSAGHTTVTIWTAGGGRANYEVTVTEQSADDLARVLRSSLGDSSVSVTTVGRSIVVGGTINDNARCVRIAAMIDHFKDAAKAGNFVIVNAIAENDPLDEMRRQLSTIPGATNIHVDADGKGSVMISGRVGTKTQAALILERARRLAGQNLAADGKVIDRLELATTTQVGVKVYVLEIDDTGLKQLGLRLQGAYTDPSSGKIIYTDPQFPLVEAANQAGKAFTIGSFFRSVQLAPTIDAIVQTGHASVLSSPDLVTLPGQKATFLVGGEVPYVISAGLGASSIVFKDYGVKLEVTPTILGNGAVETLISPEISDLDFSNGIQLNGYTIPALKTSRISTDLITQPGESIVMAGLLKRVEQRSINKIPGLGDLPILGKLFRSTRYQRSQSDVIFVMTPEIITR